MRATRITRRTSAGSSATPSGGGIDATSATRVTRSGATAATASACGPPADQPITPNRSTSNARDEPLRPLAQRPRAHDGPAAVDAPAGARRARPRCDRRDAARAVSRRRRAGRRRAARPDRRRRRGSARDDERRPHSERAVIRDGAPDQVSPRRELQVQIGPRAGVDDAEAGDVTRPDALQAQVVLVLAEVRQLDHRVARLHMRARERERVLRRDDLRARERDAAEGECREDACRDEPDRDEERASLDQRDALEPVRARNDPRRVEAQPLLEQRRVHGTEVRGRLQVAVGVEARRRARGTRRSAARPRASRSGSPSRRRRGRCRPSRSPAPAGRTPTRRA